MLHKIKRDVSKLPLLGICLMLVACGETPPVDLPSDQLQFFNGLEIILNEWKAAKKADNELKKEMVKTEMLRKFWSDKNGVKVNGWIFKVYSVEKSHVVLFGPNRRGGGLGCPAFVKGSYFKENIGFLINLTDSDWVKVDAAGLRELPHGRWDSWFFKPGVYLEGVTSIVKL